MNSEKRPRPYIARWRTVVVSDKGPRDASTRLILVALAENAKHDGSRCFPSITTLMAATALSKRSVIAHLQKAADQGWLSKRRVRSQKGDWNHNSYQLVVPESLSAEFALSPYIGGAKSAPKKVQNLHPTGAKSAHEPDIEPDKEPVAHARPDGLPESVATELWSDFIDHRKSLKRPMTDKATKMLVAKLTQIEADGFSAADALRESIINGWRGVFPPKAGDRTANTVKPSQRRVSPSDHWITSYD